MHRMPISAVRLRHNDLCGSEPCAYTTILVVVPVLKHLLVAGRQYCGQSEIPPELRTHLFISFLSTGIILN